MKCVYHQEMDCVGNLDCGRDCFEVKITLKDDWIEFIKKMNEREEFINKLTENMLEDLVNISNLDFSISRQQLKCKYFKDMNDEDLIETFNYIKNFPEKG